MFITDSLDNFFFLDSSSDESSTSGSDHIIGARGQNEFIKGENQKVRTFVEIESETQTKVNFEEKKQRLQTILFGSQELSVKDDEIFIPKGNYKNLHNYFYLHCNVSTLRFLL